MIFYSVSFNVVLIVHRVFNHKDTKLSVHIPLYCLSGFCKTAMEQYALPLSTSHPLSMLAGNEMSQVFDFTWLVPDAGLHRVMHALHWPTLAKGDQWEITCIFHFTNGVFQLLKWDIPSCLTCQSGETYIRKWLVPNLISFCYSHDLQKCLFENLVSFKVFHWNMAHETACYHYYNLQWQWVYRFDRWHY